MRPTEVERADATSIRIPIEGAGGALREGALIAATSGDGGQHPLPRVIVLVTDRASGPWHLRDLRQGPFHVRIGDMSARAVCKPSSVPTGTEAPIGDGHPSRAVGRPTAHAADPRAGQRASPPAGRPARVAPSYLALLQVEFARFTPVPDPGVERRHRHCGTGPRLTTDGCCPPPCAVELGLSSRHGRVTPPTPRDHPTASLTTSILTAAASRP